MERSELTEEARTCRAHAKSLGESERKLLLRIADAFDEIACRREARRTIEATRCW